jgi:hypothetical protein
VSDHLRTLLLGSTHVERGKILPWAGLRTGITFGVLAGGAFTAGQAARILPLAIGSVFVAFAEAGEDVGRRWRTMAWVTLWLMLAAAAGILLSEQPWFGVPASMGVALLGGVAGVAGGRAAVGGMLTVVAFTIFLGAPQLPSTAVENALLVGLAGAVITIVTVAPHLIRDPGSLRRNLVPTSGLWSRIRPQLSTANPFVRHGVRLALLIGVATIVADASGVEHAYWLPMTIAWITKPDSDGTVSSVAGRLLGTLAGLAACVLLILVFHVQGTLAVALCALAAGLVIAFIRANYALGVLAITVLVVMVFSIEGDPVTSAIDVLLAATVLAAIMTVVASFAWRRPPTPLNDSIGDSADSG